METEKAPEWVVPNENEINVETQNPFGTSMIVIIVSYLLIVFKIAPSFMKSRPPYQLKGFMIVYNIYQIIACGYVILKICTIDLPALTYGTCVDYVSGTQVEKDFSHLASVIYLLKTSETIETVVFVLRKKQNQVSFLHVFHHCALVFLTYNLNVTYKSSSALFPAFINCCVHIIMYTYYLMAAVLPSKIVALLTPFKKAITTIQMIQFTIVLLQVVVTKSRGCKFPEILLAVYVMIVSVIFYGFYDFYKKSYTTSKKAKSTAKEH